MDNTDLQNRLVVAISSRALFDLDESHTIYQDDGIDAYRQFQIDNEANVLAPGSAYPLVKKCLALKHPETNERLVEVILLSRNSADTGLRIFNSIQAHTLDITRAAFTTGNNPYPYISAFKAHLFLSMHHEDVINALNANVAAATLLSTKQCDNNEHELRIAFDGDAVLFSDHAEQVYQTHGLEVFKASEKAQANEPLAPGPFKGFLSKLHQIQQCFPEKQCPIRTALITARDAPSHERVVKTLRSWGVRLDEALFLGGLSKKDFLTAFAADIFFDDQHSHCEDAAPHVASAHVPHGVKNQLVSSLQTSVKK